MSIILTFFFFLERKICFGRFFSFFWTVSEGKSICLQHGRPGFDPWVRKIPWRRKWQLTSVFLPGKFHGWRNIVGYSPWSRKELDMTEQLYLLSFSSYILHHYLLTWIAFVKKPEYSFLHHSCGSSSYLDM